MIIKTHFLASAQQYSADVITAKKLWRELAEKYSAKRRHYHTLDHLDAILKELVPLQSYFRNWHVIVFAVAYHDAIYNPLRSNNEEKSALLAVDRMRSIDTPEPQISKCQQLILATRKHEPADYETNLFTDADLSILGSDGDTYNRYLKKYQNRVFDVS